MALPYVDLFITDDDKLSRLIRRATQKMPFRTAEVLTKADFDARFSLPDPANIIPVEEQIRLCAYRLYVQRGGRNGFALDDWLKAEAEIRGVEQRTTEIFQTSKQGRAGGPHKPSFGLCGVVTAG